MTTGTQTIMASTKRPEKGTRTESAIVRSEEGATAAAGRRDKRAVITLLQLYPLCGLSTEVKVFENTVVKDS